MSQKFFITGTDTGIGKTLVTTALIHQLQTRLNVIAGKPIASGCEYIQNKLENEDARLMLETLNNPIPYEYINPFAFEPAIAPHLAAKRVGVNLSMTEIENKLQALFNTPHDICLLEGAGGWHCPINDTHTLADFAKHLNAHIIVVIGIRLGALNHALLTLQNILNMGCPIAGWVGNVIDKNMPEANEYVEYFTQQFSAPCLGVIPHLENPTAHTAATYLKLEHLKVSITPLANTL